MGQFGPTVQRHRRFALRPDLTVYTIGFATASLATFATAGWLASVWGSAPNAIARWILLGAAGTLFGVEVARISAGDLCSLGFRRQTPQELGRSVFGIFLWGLDTGTPLTTVRATPLPLFGLLLVLLGFGRGWIAGAAYAAGFLTALWTACYAGDLLMSRGRDVPFISRGLSLHTVRLASRYAALSLLAVGGTALVL